MNQLLPLAARLVLAVSPVEEAPFAPDRPLASLIPERCAVFVEAPGLSSLLALGLAHDFVHALAASPVGAVLRTALPLAPEAALARADAWLGASATALASELTAQGVGLAYEPRHAKTVLVARARDAAALAEGLDLVLDALERQAGWPGAFDRPARRVHDADVWVLGDALVARRGALLVAGNDAGLVEETLALAADPIGRGLLARTSLERELAARRTDAVLWAWLELEELEPFGDDGFRELRAAERSPAVHGLLGARIATLLAARALAAELALDGTGAVLELRAVDAPVVPSLTPFARDGDVPAPIETGGELGSALLYRDYARFFSQRAALFPPEALAGFAEAVTNGALFFEGRDLGEEVLSGVSPWLRLVARDLDHPAGHRPDVPLPGLALVAVLDDAREGERWTAAFQTLVSIVNVDRAQAGERALRLVVGHEGDAEVSAARFATPAPGEGVDVRYNLAPALAVSGRHLVLGTHESLVREVVRELAGAEPLAAGDARETLALDAAALARALAASRAFLVARKMLVDGLDRAAAEEELDGLRLVLESFAGLRVALHAPEPAAPVLRIELPFRGAAR